MIDFSTISRPFILLGVFLVVGLVALAVTSAVNARLAVRKRIATQLGPRNEAGPQSLRGVSTETAWVRLVNFIEKRGLSLADTKDDQLRKKMIAAGYLHPAAPRIFTFIRLALTLSLPVAFVVISYSTGNPPSLMKMYLFGAFLALLGLYLPNLVLTAKADRRRQRLLNGFPDALDLMLVCVEAGLGLEAAFDRVGREMVRSQPLISEMMGAVVLELRAGRSREDALRRMADRAGIDEIRSFSTLLIQSGKLGSSIAQTLRIYAAEMREKRRLRAEEKAHRIPVLISLPLVGCMLPVMVGVLMLPAAIRVIRTLLPTMAN